MTGEDSDETQRVPEIYFLYRRISPSQFEKKAGKPRLPAFHLRQEPSLSVWDSRFVTPRQILQFYIDAVREDITSEDENKAKKALNRLNSNGTTPEEMYEKGWRVVRLCEEDFIELGFSVGEPREDGHRDVLGTEEDFQNSANALVERCEVLTATEVLEPENSPYSAMNTTEK
jgi:hypothetical protein